MTTTCGHCASGRRDFIKIAFGAGAAAALSGRFQLPSFAASKPAKAKAVILLWMQGGPSQLDTFDPKPGAETGGPHKAIETKTKGLLVSEHLPRIAQTSDSFSVIRTLFSKDPNHDTARYLLHTGYRTDPTVDHPHLGSLLAAELGTRAEGLPGCITLGKEPGAGSGYLPPELSPLLIEKIENPLEDLKLANGVTSFRLADREKLLWSQNEGFAAEHAETSVDSQRKAYERAFSLMRSPHLKAFDISSEKDETKKLYGNSPFGRACLMARRLVEVGVRFVEVTLADWDTHADNFNRTKGLMEQLDPGMSGLLQDLAQRGLLDETLVVWMGEFGRTPRINGGNGRDHWTRSFCAALAGGGVAGGRLLGRTNPLGTEAQDRPVSVQDLFATIYGQLGVDPAKKYMTPSGRPIKILEGGDPLKELLS
ncbi:MAG TPA: DUF1501 domain-containing protein [Planctomycetota bacterium]|nr:DUF1501 domain-containing protein [Planctomycetota bacterium]